MPRRKKAGQSPARQTGGRTDGGSFGHNSGNPLRQGYDPVMASNVPLSAAAPNSAVMERIVKSMQEMFSHLDPDVIYIILSECDFKVENAMDSLLELSVAAEVAVPNPTPVSGFERTAAALLTPRHFSELRSDTQTSTASHQPTSPPSADLLTEERNLFVDQELETLTAQEDVTEEHQSSVSLSDVAPLSSIPPPPVPKQALPELLQSSLEAASGECFIEQQSSSGSLVELLSGASSPLDQLSTWNQDVPEGQGEVLDFTHLVTETSAEKPKLSLDLAASGRPSAFQVYKKQDPSHSLSDRTEPLLSNPVVDGTRSKMNLQNCNPQGYMASPWNSGAPAFSPCIHGNQGPAFITPVAQTPFNWFSQFRHVSPWLNQAPVSQAPLKPSAVIPKSWALPAAPQVPVHSTRLRLQGKVLVLLRGAPGSGKSTLARAVLEHNPDGVILSTDDYFTRNGKYEFDPTVLGEAHEWNHKRAKDAFNRGANPIIIDNTNLQGWEMKPYVAQALKHGYKVLFKEPDTWWKNKPRELERRSRHNVPVETIRRMLNGYERFVTVQSIMGSHMPEFKQQLLLENKSSQPMSSETPGPDLVCQPGLTEGCKKSHPQLSSSLPDVSSFGCSGEVAVQEDNAHKFTELLDLRLTESHTSNPDISDLDEDIDLGELDSELEIQLELNHQMEDQRIPDCVVESVINEDRSGEEIHVDYSESIRQRVRRERPSRRSGFEKLEPAGLVTDSDQPDKEKPNNEDVEVVETVRCREEEKEEAFKMLNFVGDWPSEGSLKQRQARKREQPRETEGRADDEEKTKCVASGPERNEFQKLLDLIQTGVASVQTCSSGSHPVSPSSGEEFEREHEAGSMFEESNSEEKQSNGVNNSKGELPDCVLNWKAVDSCIVRELKADGLEEIKKQNDESGTIERDVAVSAFGQKTLSEDLQSSNVTSDTGESLDNKDKVSTDVDYGPENGSESGAGTDGRVSNETCQSPACEILVETESGGSSQERKHHQGRRSGKLCKLALTFTQNCLSSSSNDLDCPNSTAESSDITESSVNADVTPVFNPNCDTNLDLKPDLDLSTESSSEAHLQPTPVALVETGCFTQTEPQDFAFIWRLNHQDSSDDANVSSDIKVLYGESSRFVPEPSSAVSAAVAVDLSGHSDVSYYVVHEKGTQVEEKELVVTEDRVKSLRILSCHFKLVSFDTLEDLYDKCHQDLEWTTNLLLDSGERFFRDEDVEEYGAADVDNTFGLCGELHEAAESSKIPDALHEHQHVGEQSGTETGAQRSNCGAGNESKEGANYTDGPSFNVASVPPTNKAQSDATPAAGKSPLTEVCLPKEVKLEQSDNNDHRGISEPGLGGGAWSGSLYDEVIIEDSRFEFEDDVASMDEINRLLQAELEEMEREEKKRKEKSKSQHLDIQTVELKLPTELALQLAELFGPVGIDPGTCSTDDFAVQMDLNLAKLLHQQWKETIQERQRQAALSFHLLQEGSTQQDESQVAKYNQQDRMQPANLLTSKDGNMPLAEASGSMPLMDHWNVSRPHVSLRDIIKEEQALQDKVQKSRQSRVDLDRWDGATLLKEKQLFSLFPTIDRHFLQDIFRDHNYSLTQTELFLRSLLVEEPVKTVVAPEAPRTDHHRTSSKEREKRQKSLEPTVPNYQDTEDPEYEDFRAEASLQRRRQLESFAKAAEAYKQGRKEVASFYAQQGHLHGQRMREANHRAAVQIFNRVNSSLLPRNILDLHGLHVDEALEHLAQVLQDKTADCEQGLCQPQLSVITGRGNHSQGGVARIRPAVIDYLTNKHYRFTEPKPGLVLVSLR
ncbi:NEDD4-binding protein 2 isoform X2 [Melanotaenia boesemani]|uniref:NEDD4-binding protein 2 isoform X2 n=1 Tax=Melanotaenia boesemani TaxID=1250792 RepID=UPI001C0456D0|nr:NEDD4-binding protein 2 isoform X2 [Melanotaenia boesemani]